MDENKQKGTCSSSFTELFGSKESQPSSPFASMFSPTTPKVLGTEYKHSEVRGKTANDTWSSKNATQDDFSKGNYEEAQKTETKLIRSNYQDQRAPLPCPLSSSIDYGSRDTYYYQSQSTENAGINSSQKNNGVGDLDPGMATRGNWWLGSLYY